MIRDSKEKRRRRRRWNFETYLLRTCTYLTHSLTKIVWLAQTDIAHYSTLFFEGKGLDAVSSEEERMGLAVVLQHLASFLRLRMSQKGLAPSANGDSFRLFQEMREGHRIQRNRSALSRKGGILVFPLLLPSFLLRCGRRSIKRVLRQKRDFLPLCGRIPTTRMCDGTFVLTVSLIFRHPDLLIFKCAHFSPHLSFSMLRISCAYYVCLEGKKEEKRKTGKRKNKSFNGKRHRASERKGNRFLNFFHVHLLSSLFLPLSNRSFFFNILTSFFGQMCRLLMLPLAHTRRRLNKNTTQSAIWQLIV